uniref:RNA-binding protein KhpB n=1 Tax=Eiseniibacteriota bacterium TaxID=2212470 RepID=A0A832I3Z4_UNCEI
MEPRGSVFEGRTLDEAVRKGLEALGLSRAEVMITMIEEGSGGFLGFGARPYKVRVAPRPGGAPHEPEAEREGDRRRRERGGRDRGRGGRDRGDRGRREGAPAAAGARESRREESRGERREGGRDERRREGVREERRFEGRREEPRGERREGGRDERRREGVREERRFEGRREEPRGERREAVRDERRREGAREERRFEGRREEPRREDRFEEERAAARTGEVMEGRLESGVEPVEGAPAGAATGRAGDDDRRRRRRGRRGGRGRGGTAPSQMAMAAGAPGEGGVEEAVGVASAAPPAGGEAGRGLTAEQLEAEGRRWTEQLLAAMGFEATVSARAEGDHVDVSVQVARDDQLLTGPKGEVREALQHLLNRMVNRGEGSRYHLQLEINDFWHQREAELEQIARDMAERAVESGDEVVSEYLNAQERRIIHQTLKDDARVKTYALGTGMIKRIAVAPAGFAGRASDEE